MVYDPHIHRELRNPLSNMEAFVSVVKCTIGTGCLEMPRAFCNAGWLGGLIGTYTIGFIIVYSINLLLRCTYATCVKYERAFITYSECMQLALLNGPNWLRRFAGLGGFLVKFFMVFYHFGVCCVYILFIADNLKQLGDEFFTEIDFHIYIVGLTGPLVLFFMIKNLKHLVPFSIIASALMILAFVLMLIFILNDLPALSERKPFNKFSQFPLFFGTILFATESVGGIIAIENHMSNPKDYLGFTGILAMGSFISLGIYAAFGFLGYWRFGCQVYSSITLNLPEHNYISYTTKLALAIAIILSYTLQGYIIVDLIWFQYMINFYEDENHTILEYNVRFILVLLTVFGAVISPDISIFLPLVGALCLTNLSFVFPGLIDYCINYREGNGNNSYVLFRDGFLIIFGILGFISGTWVSTKLFKEEFAATSGPNPNSLLFYSFRL